MAHAEEKDGGVWQVKEAGGRVDVAWVGFGRS